MSNIRVKEPKMFYLSVNYRSHAGIVNCAHSIIDVLQRFWQDSIDSLPRERGNAPGAKPIFYTDLSPEFIRGVSKSPFSLDRLLTGCVSQCRFLSRNSNSVASVWSFPCLFFFRFLIKFLSKAKRLSWEPISVCRVLSVHKVADLCFYRYTSARRES